MKNQVRIIGGKFRGRKISFHDHSQLRPTPDRIRETVFNWLMPDIQGAVVLDCFAGSGALGFEALSRGAAHVVMIDSDRKIVTQLKNNCGSLKIENATLLQATAPKAIPVLDRPYDIVFLDPPFRKQLIGPCCEHLQTPGLLAPDALIYIEAEPELEILPIPERWEILKQKTAGQVQYLLVKAS